MSLAEPCVYAEGFIGRKTHGDGSRHGIIFRKKSYHVKSISHLISGKNTGRGDEYE